MIIPNCNMSAKGETISDGIKVGAKWGLNPKVKQYDRIKKRLDERYSLYQEHFEAYKGGHLSRYKAIISMTENLKADPCKCTKDRKLKECGIMGISWSIAEECDVDVRDSEASIWCFGRSINKRVLNLRKKYPATKQMLLHEQYMLTELFRGIGPSAEKLMYASGAMNIDKNGTLKHKNSFKRILVYTKSLDHKPDKLEYIMKGRRFSKFKLGFRTKFAETVFKVLMRFYGVSQVEALPFGEPVLIDRPTHFQHYPGKALHGKCSGKKYTPKK